MQINKNATKYTVSYKIAIIFEQLLNLIKLYIRLKHYISMDSFTFITITASLHDSFDNNIDSFSVHQVYLMNICP